MKVVMIVEGRSGMFWEVVQHKSKGVFKRLMGVSRSTFDKMVEVVKEQTLVQRKHSTKGSLQNDVWKTSS